MTSTAILGISCDYHDAAAALVIDGEVVAAAEEERFTRQKHDASLPANAIAACLTTAGISPDDLETVVFHEKPLGVISRVLAARQRQGPSSLRGFTTEFPRLLQVNLMVANRVEKLLDELGATRRIPFRYGEHHLSHAAAAFHPSPFDTAAILTIDGIGEWSTASVGHGVRRRIDLLAEQRYPNSLGLLYSLVTVWCGFEANEGEYKLMGLAPFGEPAYEAALRELVTVHDDGSLRIDMRRLKSWSTRPSRMRQLTDLFDGPPRAAGEPIGRREADLARSMQVVCEEVVLKMAQHAADLTGERRVCLAGGVALNCVANGRLLREGPFDDVWVQPAAGDAGSAMGAALWWWHEQLQQPRTPRPALWDTALGPSYRPDEVAAWLDAEGVPHERIDDRAELADRVAARLADGAVVAWFEGRMEFGPRALGHRSILADPRSPTVQSELNLKVKGRESFRPFAPAVLWEHAAEWFELDRPSPHMLFTFDVAEAHRRPVEHEPDGLVERVQVPRSEIPACTHVDLTARVQTVHPELTPAFHQLLEAFHRTTGCPVLLNTSFNHAGEPIVCTPADALAAARRCHLDVLVLEDCLVELGALDEGGVTDADDTVTP